MQRDRGFFQVIQGSRQTFLTHKYCISSITAGRSGHRQFSLCGAKGRCGVHTELRESEKERCKSMQKETIQLRISRRLARLTDLLICCASAVQTSTFIHSGLCQITGFPNTSIRTQSQCSFFSYARQECNQSVQTRRRFYKLLPANKANHLCQLWHSCPMVMNMCVCVCDRTSCVPM